MTQRAATGGEGSCVVHSMRFWRPTTVLASNWGCPLSSSMARVALPRRTSGILSMTWRSAQEGFAKESSSVVMMA